MFGIEIRKTGNISNIYRDVDRILQNYDIKPGEVNKAVQSEAIVHALHKMLKTENYFCICTVDKCVSISQIVIPKERYDIYRSQHCVHWNEMMPDFRAKLIAMVLDDFRSVLNPQQ